MLVWALWSARVGPYSNPELLELFTLQSEAEAVRDGLIGKPRQRGEFYGRWADDDDFPDLYVQRLDVR